MGLKESLRRLQEQENADRKLSIKREINKELTKIKHEKLSEKRCIICNDIAQYAIKGSNECYCKDCAIEYFGDVKNLKKIIQTQAKKKDEIYFITGNDKKFDEAKKIIPELLQLKIDLDEIQEIDAKKVIEHKLLEAKKKHTGSFVVEDTSLYLDCMKGLPGPLIKWFLSTIGNEGLYDLTVRYRNDRAEARTLLGFYHRGKIRYFQGIIKGRIASPKRSDFGWDSIFIPDGYDERFCDMDQKQKNEISMRAKAFSKMRESLVR